MQLTPNAEYDATESIHFDKVFTTHDSVAEWLRRQPAKLFRIASVSSNLTAVDFFFTFLPPLAVCAAHTKFGRLFLSMVFFSAPQSGRVFF